MFNSNNNGYGGGNGQFQQPTERRMAPMSIASIACAVIGLITIMTGVFAAIFGSLAVLFSFLSKGSADRPERPAVYGRYIGLAAAAIGVALTIYSLSVVFIQYGSIEAFYDAYVYSIEEEYGIDLDY